MLRRILPISRPLLRQPFTRVYSSISTHVDGSKALPDDHLLATGVEKLMKGWHNAVQSGSFNGTYDAYCLMTFSKGKNRVEGACSHISTLDLRKGFETHQYVNVRSRCRRPFMSRDVLIKGQNVGRAELYFPSTSVPPDDLFLLYYDRYEGLLRFQTRSGEPFPRETDVDLVAKADNTGIRPLLLLAQEEGLIEKVPSGYLTSLSFESNVESGYYIRSNMQKDGKYQPAILLPGTSRAFRFTMLLESGSEKSFVRFFPYIHDDGTLRLWDVEQKSDLDLSRTRGPRRLQPVEVKKRIPRLFTFAQGLGYWQGL